MMGGGIHIQQQADGSVLINLVPGTSSPATSPQQNLSSPAAAPRTAPNAGGSDRRRDGASTSGSDGAFKCVVKGCKRKRAKEGFKTEHALVTHVLCHHKDSDAAKRLRQKGYKKVRHQNKVIRARGGEPRDRTPTASPSPVVTATVSGSRSDAARESRDRAKKKVKKTKTATPSKATRAAGDGGARQPMSPSRLFAKSPGQKQQLPPSPPNSDDETSSDEDEDFSDSENAVSGGEDDRDASEDDDVEDIVETNEEALDFDADDTKPENAWEVVGKDESVEAKVKIEPIPAAKSAKKAPDAAASKPGPTTDFAGGAKQETEAVKPPKPKPVEPAVEVKREADAAAPAAPSPPPMSAGAIESSDVEEVGPPAPPAPPAPPPLPSPRDPPTSRHFFAARYSADVSATDASQRDTFTLRVLSRAREAYGEKTRRRASGNDSRPRDASSANVRPACRFADAKEYAAYNAALVLDNAAAAAVDTVAKKPPKRNVTHWHVHSSLTKEEIRERAEAGAKVSCVVLIRNRAGESAGGGESKGPLPPSLSRSGFVPAFAPVVDELVLLWRGGDSPQSHVLGVVKDASDDGGRLGVDVESSELLRALSSRDAFLARGTKTLIALGHDLKTSRREFDAAHVVPLLIAPLLAPILTGEPFYTEWNKDKRSAVTGEANVPGTKHVAGTLPLSAGAAPRNLREVLDAIGRWTAAGRFNDAQARAIRLCVCPGDLPHETVRRCAGVALLHGPPGTGKTSTLVGAISALLLCCPAPRVLVCAPSNAAVDELVLRLARGRIKSLEGDGTERGMEAGELIRVGALDQISTRVSTYALDTLVDKAIDNLNKRRDGLTARAHEEQRERRTILERARVVATTTSAAGAEYFKDYKFDVVIVDEAAQSSEAATLIPLMRRASHVKRIILAGDHRQLPAVAHAEDLASRRAYGTSLFERLVLPRGEGDDDDGDDDDLRAHPASTLIVQHRMNAEISRFPSAFFYGGCLRDAPKVAHQTAFCDASVVSDGFVVRLSAYAFLDWHGSEETDSGGDNDRSYFNKSEASVVAATVRAALRHARADATVAVVTPYKSQKAEIWRHLSRGEDSVVDDPRVRCNTVDSYQGQEADIVVFSCVRTRSLGFLRDERRLNVALTRARECLLIVGSAELLRKGPEERAWPSLVADAEARGRLHAVTRAGPGQAEGRLVAPDARQELERQIQADRLNAQRRLAAGSKTATRAQTAPPSEEARGAKRRAPNLFGAPAVSPKRPRGTHLPVVDVDDRANHANREDDDDDAVPPVAAAGVAPPSSGRTRKFQPTAKPRPEPEARSARGVASRRVVVGKKRLVAHRRARDSSPPPVAAAPPTQIELERWKDKLEKQQLALDHERLDLARQQRQLGLAAAAPRGERRRGGRGSRRPDRRGGRGDRSVFERSVLPRGDATSRGRRYE